MHSKQQDVFKKNKYSHSEEHKSRVEIQIFASSIIDLKSQPSETESDHLWGRDLSLNVGPRF